LELGKAAEIKTAVHLAVKPPVNKEYGLKKIRNNKKKG